MNGTAKFSVQFTHTYSHARVINFNYSGTLLSVFVIHIQAPVFHACQTKK